VSEKGAIENCSDGLHRPYQDDCARIDPYWLFVLMLPGIPARQVGLEASRPQLWEHLHHRHVEVTSEDSHAMTYDASSQVVKQLFESPRTLGNLFFRCHTVHVNIHQHQLISTTVEPEKSHFTGNH
jgi:hypothetical protein